MTSFESFYQELISDEHWYETMQYVHKGKDIEQGIKEALLHLMADGERLKGSDLSKRKQLVNSWMTNKRFPRENVVKVDQRERLKNL